MDRLKTLFTPNSPPQLARRYATESARAHLFADRNTFAEVRAHAQTLSARQREANFNTWFDRRATTTDHVPHKADMRAAYLEAHDEAANGNVGVRTAFASRNPANTRDLAREIEAEWDDAASVASTLREQPR